MRKYRKTWSDRAGNMIFGVLTRAGVGPAHLLTTRGRKSGLPRVNPVIVVERDNQLWLVAPYGSVPWVLNARASGEVTLRRRRDTRHYFIREVDDPAAAGPILKQYIGIASATRPYFEADKNAPVDDFVAQANRHPVFALAARDEDAR